MRREGIKFEINLSFLSLPRQIHERSFELHGLEAEKSLLARVASWEGEKNEPFRHQVPLSWQGIASLYDVSGRLNVVKGLKPTNQNIGFG
jgi:hypothetical protein